MSYMSHILPSLQTKVLWALKTKLGIYSLTGSSYAVRVSIRPPHTSKKKPEIHKKLISHSTNSIKFHGCTWQLQDILALLCSAAWCKWSISSSSHLKKKVVYFVSGHIYGFFISPFPNLQISKTWFTKLAIHVDIRMMQLNNWRINSSNNWRHGVTSHTKHLYVQFESHNLTPFQPEWTRTHQCTMKDDQQIWIFNDLSQMKSTELNTDKGGSWHLCGKESIANILLLWSFAPSTKGYKFTEQNGWG